jgi:hypothetical protein
MSRLTVNFTKAKRQALKDMQKLGESYSALICEKDIVEFTKITL